MTDAVTKPRLWGLWEPQFFGSGTTIVRLHEYHHKPYLYIHADSAINEDRCARDRYAMCYQLADYMNGGDRPDWLDDFERTSEGGAKSLSGGSILAAGPMVDVDPPRCDWRWDDSEDARSDRARLLDAVFFKLP